MKSKHEHRGSVGNLVRRHELPAGRGRSRAGFFPRIALVLVSAG